jgi:hypothetical protein
MRGSCRRRRLESSSHRDQTLFAAIVERARELYVS